MLLSHDQLEEPQARAELEAEKQINQEAELSLAPDIMMPDDEEISSSAASESANELEGSSLKGIEPQVF